jgi:hypothetical protein
MMRRMWDILYENEYLKGRKVSKNERCKNVSSQRRPFPSNELSPTTLLGVAVRT